MNPNQPDYLLEVEDAIIRVIINNPKPFTEAFDKRQKEEREGLVIYSKEAKTPISVYRDEPVEIVGRDLKLLKQVTLLEKYASIDSLKSIVIYGETGTGKELFARHYHKKTGRSKIFTINCAFLEDKHMDVTIFGSVKGGYTDAVDKEGVLASNNGGTVFLDEAHNLSLSSQNKLLRFIEQSEFIRLGSTKVEKSDVKLIFGYNEDPKVMLEKGSIKKDFYNRIVNYKITVPPLRQRKDDIDLLVRYFVAEYANKVVKEKIEITTEVMKKLRRYHWRIGNVRELKGLIEKMVYLLPEWGIRIDSLPDDFVFDEDTESDSIESLVGQTIGGDSPNIDLSLLEFEKKYIQYQLNKQGSVPKAAKVLKMNAATLYWRLRKWGMKAPNARR